jgi:hypothetical protein
VRQDGKTAGIDADAECKLERSLFARTSLCSRQNTKPRCRASGPANARLQEHTPSRTRDVQEPWPLVHFIRKHFPRAARQATRSCRTWL